jgi:hypothetical protein
VAAVNPTSTHNSTHNTQKGKLRSAGRALSVRVVSVVYSCRYGAVRIPIYYISGNGNTKIFLILISIYFSNNKSVTLTISVRSSHPQPQCTLHHLCEDSVLFVCVGLRVSLCMQQHPRCDPAICFVYPPFLMKRRSTSNRTNKSLSRLFFNIQTALTG